MTSGSRVAKPDFPTVPKKHESPKREGYREMVESIVVAFVLAFLFRTFEAEAFVIPTGSMAPTLMGRHKDVHCPQCEFDYPVSASEENAGPGNGVAGATCPNCRFATDISDQHSFNGDRILVLKFPYTFSEPERFDVVVFKFPEDPKVNYIKRLVGLPGEEVRIWRGDLYTRPLESDEDVPWRIVRKTAHKQRHLTMPVYDNDHQSQLLREAGWPARWQPEEGGTWTSSDDGKEFQLLEPSPGLAWLEYHHRVPTAYDWQRMREGQGVDQPRAQLITDCYGYNLGTSEHEGLTPNTEGLGTYWVGDLILSFEVSVHEAKGELVCELGEGNRRYRVLFDLATGQATLRIRDVGDWEDLATSATELRGTGEFRVAFANVDDQLLLWVDDSEVPFGHAAEYEAPAPAESGPGVGDLQPAAIGARAAAVTVRHLRLDRDIYYGSGKADMLSRSDPQDFADLYSDPVRWKELFQDREVTFQVEPGNYFVLGDNNPRSKDGRLWGGNHTVDEHLMIGQAFFIYWPHGEPFSFSVNVLGGFGELYLPFLPHVNRMRLIR